MRFSYLREKTTVRRLMDNWETCPHECKKCEHIDNKAIATYKARLAELEEKIKREE